MGVFRNSKHFYECVGELMDRAKQYPALLKEKGYPDMILK